jgi:hypothetical protein
MLSIQDFLRDSDDEREDQSDEEIIDGHQPMDQTNAGLGLTLSGPRDIDDVEAGPAEEVDAYSDSGDRNGKMRSSVSVVW